jgi:hypothetical protein
MKLIKFREESFFHGMIFKSFYVENIVYILFNEL